MDTYSDDIVLKVIDTYGETDSIEKTAKICGISTVKVRKILITHDLWSSETSYQIGYFRHIGKTIKEIADIFGISEASVSAYLPYDKGLYKTGNPSKDAERAELYRKRIEACRERQVAVRKQSKNFVTVKGDICPFVIRLTMDFGELDEFSRDILSRFGQSSDGRHFYRDVLVPGDITINALHYVIQKCFGWCNSHARSFELPEDRFMELTGGNFMGYQELCGILFLFDYGEESALYWNDDYENCESFSTWIRRKYTGPYVYGGKVEFPEEQKISINRAIKKDRENYLSMKFEDDIPPFIYSTKLNELCSRLTLSSVLAAEGEKLPDRKTFMSSIRYDNPKMPSIIPCTDKILYEYDFGDGWDVEITRLSDYPITDKQFRTVVEEHRPLCLKRDGIMLMDDVGGVGGYISFLGSVFGGINSEFYEYGDAKADYEWANSNFGWTKKAPSPLKLL